MGRYRQHFTATDALKRCKDNGLPLLSIVVNSGNGVHLYWLLDEPYLIDDVGDLPAVEHRVGRIKARKEKISKNSSTTAVTKYISTSENNLAA